MKRTWSEWCLGRHGDRRKGQQGKARDDAQRNHSVIDCWRGDLSYYPSLSSLSLLFLLLSFSLFLSPPLTLLGDVQ